MKKKTGKRILSFLMAVIMVIGMLQVPGLTLKAHAESSGSCGDSTTYTLNDDGVLTFDGVGGVYVPKWSRADVKKVVIKKGVTDINGACLDECYNLESFEVEEGNKVYLADGDVLFTKDKKKIVQYPAGKAGNNYTIPNTVETIGDNSFDHSTKLKTVIIPDSVSVIEYDAFYCSGITSITIPESVVSIGDYAFRGCELTTVIIPKSVTSIGAGAFGSCPELFSISVDPANVAFSAQDGILFNRNKTQILCYPQGKNGTSYTIPDTVTCIGEDAFVGCFYLKEIIIPQTVTDIERDAFPACLSLEEIIIPEGVTEIKEETFAECKKLKKVTIPKSVVYIDAYSFMECYALTDIIYNGSENDWKKLDVDLEEVSNYTVTYNGGAVGDQGNCGADTRYVLDVEGVLTISGTGAVTEHPWTAADVRQVVIEAGISDLSGAALINCTSLEAITVDPDNAAYSSEDGVLFNKNKTKILQYPACKAGTAYSIPASVTAIGEYAFTRCNKLSGVTIPDGVTAIEDGAFCRSSNIADISIPESVTEIGQAAFFGCKSIEDITIPENVTTIEKTVFYGCSALEALSLSDKLTTVSENAFGYCSGLKDVYYGGGEDKWDNVIIDNTNSCLTTATIHYMKGSCGAKATWTLTKDGLLTISGEGEIKYLEYAGDLWKPEDVKKLVIEEGITTIGNEVFLDCQKLTEAEIAESVTTLGYESFYCCYALTDIVLPENVTNVGEEAFAECQSLKTVTIPRGLLTIGDDAFNGCDAITDVYYGGTETEWSGIVIGNYNESLTSANIHYTVFVTGVSLTPATKELRVGESVTLTATVAPENATNKKVSWTSSAPAVATVADGVVTAVGEGESTITVTTEDGGKTATCKVTVKGFAVTGVSIAPETLSLKVGESGTLTATVTPANADNKKVSWTSSAPAVATVADGTVTAVAEGETTITVTTEDGAKTASCKVTVTKAEAPEEPVMVEGPLGPEKPDLSRYTASGNEIAAKSINLKKTVFKDVKGIKKFNVTAGDTTAVKIKGSTLTVLKDATVTIEAVNKKKEKLAEKTITVVAPAIDTAPATEINRRGTLDLNKYILSTVAPSAWKSSNKKVASVSDNGLLLMKKSGTVKITATFPAEKGMKAKKLTIKIKITMPQFKKTTYKVKAGKTVKTAVKNAEAKDITYRIADPAIATVDAEGKVTGVSKGTTKLIMRVRDIDYETTIKVK